MNSTPQQQPPPFPDLDVNCIGKRVFDDLLKEARSNHENWLSVNLCCSTPCWLKPGDICKVTDDFYTDTSFNIPIDRVCNTILNPGDHVMFLGWKLSKFHSFENQNKNSKRQNMLVASMCFLHKDKVVHHWREFYREQFTTAITNLVANCQDGFEIVVVE